MKKFLWLAAIILLMLISVAACGKENSTSSSSTTSKSGESKAIAASLIKKESIVDVDCTSDLKFCAYARNTAEHGQLIVDQSGAENVIYEAAAGYAVREPLWSPDGRYIAFKLVDRAKYASDELGEVCMIRVSDRMLTKTGITASLDENSTEDVHYSWSGDSSRLLIEYCAASFDFAREPQPFVYWDVAAAKSVNVTGQGGSAFNASFSQDSKEIAYSAYTADGIVLKIYDCTTGNCRDAGTIETPRNRNTGIFLASPIWLSEHEILNMGMPDEDGSYTLFKVDISNGSVSELISGLDFVSCSPNGKNLLYRSTKISSYYILDLTTMQSSPVVSGMQKNAVWSKNNEMVLLWSGNGVAAVGMDGRQIGDTIVDKIGDSAPTLTSDGIWYERRTASQNNVTFQ